jgi:hypothetical protein
MNLDIVGKFGNSGTDIEGTARALLDLSKRVLEINGHEVFELNVPSEPPSPYAGYLKSLHIDLNEGNVHIWRDNESMYFRGSAEKIGILADNIASLALQERNSIPAHSHIEYYPGHFYLTEGSEPLVFTRREEPGHSVGGPTQ